MRHFLRFMRRSAGLAVSALMAAGCTIDLPGSQPPPQLFVLNAASEFTADLPRAGWQLSVDVPIAEAGLNGARIAVRRTPYMLEYFERAAWIDTAPRMIQMLLLESFENTDRIIAVARQSVAMRADYALISELREFYADYTEGRPPEVRVRLTAKLMQMPQRNIIGRTTAEYRATVQADGIEGAMQAFDQALGEALRHIVEWTLRNAPAPR
jgi:cholesterol transport system auxiliary component